MPYIVGKHSYNVSIALSVWMGGRTLPDCISAVVCSVHLSVGNMAARSMPLRYTHQYTLPLTHSPSHTLLRRTHHHTQHIAYISLMQHAVILKTKG